MKYLTGNKIMSLIRFIVFGFFILGLTSSLNAADDPVADAPIVDALTAETPKTDSPTAEPATTEPKTLPETEAPTATTTTAVPPMPDKNTVQLDSLNKYIDDTYSYVEDLDIGLKDTLKLKGDPDNYVVVYLEKKLLLIELFPKDAPNTVAAFKELVQSGFYDDTDFFRLIPNYILQGGDPTSSGYGGSGKLRNAEISGLKFQRGFVAMANNGNLISDDSQFFISFDSFPWLDGKYTIFGKIISGMVFLEEIQNTYNNDGFMNDPLIITSMVMGSKANNKKSEAPKAKPQTKIAPPKGVNSPEK